MISESRAGESDAGFRPSETATSEVATAAPFFCAFPLLLRLGLRASGASVAELTRRAWIPNYLLGAALALALVAGRAALPMDDTVAVLALAIAGPLAFWAAYFAGVLRPDERALVRGLLRRTG